MKVDSSLLKNVLPLLVSQSMDQLTVDMTSAGWNMFAMSPDRVSMVSITIPATAFAEYPEIPEETTEHIAFDTSKMLYSLKNFSGEVTLTPERGRMVLTDGAFTTRFATPDPNPSEKRIPNPPVDTSALLSADDLRKLMSATDIDRQTTMYIRATETGLRFTAYDEHGNGSEYSITPDVYEHPEDKLPVCSYPMDSFDRFVKALPRGQLMEMRYGSQLPCIVTVEDDTHSVIWMVAPRIEDDDE